MSDEQNTPNWEAIAKDAAAELHFAIYNLRAPGSGIVVNKEGTLCKHWKDMFADVMEKIPGVKVDREMMHIAGMPVREQTKAIKELKQKRKEAKR